MLYRWVQFQVVDTVATPFVFVTWWPSVAKTISAISSEHSYQYSAPDLALMLCTCL